MVDLLLVLTIFLLLAGILGSLIPGLPGPALSIIGVFVYWVGTGFAEPSVFALSLMLFAGFLALFLDFIAAYFGASEADSKTALIAGLSALLFFVFTGPLGVIIGPGAVIFLREVMKGKDRGEAFETAWKTTLALMGSILGKVLLTSFIFIVFVLSLLFL